MAKQQPQNHNNGSDDAARNFFVLSTNDESSHDYYSHDYYDHSTHHYYFEQPRDEQSQQQPTLQNKSNVNADYGKNKTRFLSLVALLLGIALIIFLCLFLGNRSSNSSVPINNSNTIEIDNGGHYYHRPRPYRHSKTTSDNYPGDNYSKEIAENTGKANGYLQEIAQNTNQTNRKLDGIQSEVSDLRSDVNNLRTDMNSGFSQVSSQLALANKTLGQLGRYEPQREKTYWDGGSQKSSENPDGYKE